MHVNIFGILVLMALCFSGCKKHKVTNPIDQLPAATQYGARTFGCLVNGKLLTPHGPSTDPILQCYYLNNTSTPGYFFNIGMKDKSNLNDWGAIVIALDSIKITGPDIYSLNEAYRNGKGYGEYDHALQNPVSFTNYLTNNTVQGQLHITKFDSIQRIVSGTFWFNAISNNGDTVAVTDGRFDMIYN